MTDKRILFFDFEVFKHLWVVVVIERESKEKTVIINDVAHLRSFYDAHHLDIWCGYNSREYDQYILKGILLGFDPWFINNELIVEGKRGWQVIRDANEFPLYNFDVSTGFHSLKQLEGFMGSTIKETDVPFDLDRPLTSREIEQVVFYCTHDVEETMKVFEYRKEEFDSQLLMIEAFDLPMTMFNKTKAQLAAAVLEAKRGRDRYDEFDLSFTDTLQVGEKYQYIVDWYKDKRNHDYNKSLVADVAGIPHVFAWGGIHAAIPNYQAEGIIAHCDVASLYPSIMIEYSFLSRNVVDKAKFTEIRNKRLQLKKEKNPMQAPLKIVINSTFGAQKDQANPLYDPRQANNICVAGQLLMLDLIEKLEGHCELIQSNTDGLFLKVDTIEQLEKCKRIASKWENRTRLTLEWGISRKIVQKDVNNYIVIDEDGSYESKGAYLKKLSETDYDLPIVNKSLVDYFIHGTPLRETIESCDDLRKFQKIIKISRLYKYALYGDERLPEKVHRVFASTNPDAPSLFKVKSEDRVEKIANTPERCFIFNDACNGLPCPKELDKEYYVQLAEKRLDDFLSEKKSKTAKLKSEIKYINYDTKSALDAVDQSEYSYFSDIVRFLITERIANIKQILILVKLEYFKQFGNIRELLTIMDALELLKYGQVRSIAKDKISGEDWRLGILESYSSDVGSSGKILSRYTIIDMDGLLHTIEQKIQQANLLDLTYKEKVAYQYEFTGGIYPTGEEADRPTLYIEEIQPALRRLDKKQFGYNVTTISLGSKIKTKMTILNALYKKKPVNAGDVIRHHGRPKYNGFFTMVDYTILE